ncbi:DUF3800 domain-containing protein [Parvibaculum sp.]|uniref:DUF3800 domain-containing protein n=1 Tax=Parvibaculum sp. TaxID=2024848 RepID=UPI0034A05645
MYFFYIDESGSRDPSTGTAEKPKDHLYVLLAVGLFERQWRPFEQTIAHVKLELADYLRRQGKGPFDLADCEVKSNWMRNAKERGEKSPFLNALDDADRERLVTAYFDQLGPRNAVIIAAVIDKRHLHDHITHETLHKKAYEFLLERIQHYMREYHPKHQALIVMDDTSKQLNRAVAMKHAYFQRAGNRNLQFPQIVEYPFFSASELSNGVQLADLLAYNVYRAFRSEDLAYPYFEMLLPHFYRRKAGQVLDGLKVWPDPSPLIGLARAAWDARKEKAPQEEGR